MRPSRKRTAERTPLISRCKRIDWLQPGGRESLSGISGGEKFWKTASNSESKKASLRLIVTSAFWAMAAEHKMKTATPAARDR